METESLADTPLDPVAVDRGADRARHGETQPRAFADFRPSQAKGRE
jgi:hypothetical protein